MRLLRSTITYSVCPKMTTRYRSVVWRTDNYTARNRELRARQRMPHFEQELNGFVKGRMKKDLQEKLLQLELVNLVMESIDKGRVELKDEL
jgi:hypothetical protein